MVNGGSAVPNVGKSGFGELGGDGLSFWVVLKCAAKSATTESSESLDSEDVSRYSAESK